MVLPLPVPPMTPTVWAGLCRKAHVGQAGGAGTAVSKGDTLEGYGRHIAAGSQFRGCGVRHGGAGVENLIDAQAAGQGAGHRDHQIGQTQKVDEDLAQIIDQGNHFALGEVAHIDFPAAEQQQCDDRQVDHQIGERIHQSGDPAGPDLHGFQMVVGFHEGGQFIGLAGKSPHHTGAHVFFAGEQRDAVQAVLSFMVERHGGMHDPPDDQ